MRTNGFQRPFNPMQIGTWALLPVLLLQFLLFATPTLPLAASIPCTIAVFACGLASAYFTYRCCTVDPVDDRLRRHLNRQRHANAEHSDNGENGATDNNDDDNMSNEERGSGENDAVKFCWVCSTDVHESSMHCKFCSKCVKRFDHHCHWLNTCVGEANYDNFFGAVGSTLAMEIARGGVLTELVVSFFVQYRAPTQGIDEAGEGSLQETSEADNWLGIPRLAIALVNTGFLAVDLVCIVMLLQLFAFHVRLRHEGITTYAYIIRDGHRKQERRRKKMELERRRISELEKAVRSGNRMRQWRLSAAGCPYVGEYLCRACDPLRLEKEKNVGLESLQQQFAEKVIDVEGNGVYDRTNGYGDDQCEVTEIVEQDEGHHSKELPASDEMDIEEHGVLDSLGSETCGKLEDGDQPRSALLIAMKDRQKMLQRLRHGDEFTGTSNNENEKKIEFFSQKSS